MWGTQGLPQNSAQLTPGYACTTDNCSESMRGVALVDSAGKTGKAEGLVKKGDGPPMKGKICSISYTL